MARAKDEAGDTRNAFKSLLAIGSLSGIALVAIVALVVLLCCAPCLWYRSLSPDLPFN
ncbi:hypothetical protein C5N14_09295 [Micromonospora sp. MW-13]|uniref:hypothetical protein n=1 Tax=unclassified Micromonospora TaxID=2617518 RepID=UPI000EDBA9C3|nr:hypothetical protein [Micromonospora sp. MW-13]RGC69458.1 hypothetical protein C5N14_09295 [Micromonospora sp. MW-13]